MVVKVVAVPVATVATVTIGTVVVISGCCDRAGDNTVTFDVAAELLNVRKNDRKRDTNCIKIKLSSNSIKIH